MPQQAGYLSTDPNEGRPLRTQSRAQTTPAASAAPAYLSTDPNEGEPDFRADNAVDEAGQNVVADHPHTRLGKVVLHALDAMNPVAAAQAFGRSVIPEAMAKAMGAGDEEASQYGPINTIVNPMRATFEAAREAFAQGDYGSAAIKALFSGVPMAGPAMAQMGDEMGTDPQKAIGSALGFAGNLVMPKLIGGARIQSPLKPKANPTETAAVAFGRERGIPIDAGTATGSQFVKNVQKKAASSFGGANTAETAQRAQAEALARTGNKLANEVSTTPIGAVEAGEAVQGALKGKIQKASSAQSDAYGRLREMEASATPDMVAAKGVKRGPDGSSAESFQDMQLAVDLRGSKTTLRPILQRLLKKKELTGQLMGAEGRAAVALDSLVTGPDFAPLSVVDAALGDLKAMARGADMPELRSSGQGIAAEAVRRLDGQVRARAAQAGPKVLQALEEGRAATRTKYETAEAMDLIAPIGGEPKAVFSRLVASKDAGLSKLRELQKQAPTELPKMARAVLEEILDKPTSEGGFKFADKAFADWQRLGAGTKKILFPKDGQVRALDNFFLLAKRIGENPNPSGTAQVMNATNVVTAIPMYAMAKILYTPTGVRALTRAMEIGVSPKPAAQAAAMAQLARAGKEAGVVIPFPKAAEADPDPKKAGRP